MFDNQTEEEEEEEVIFERDNKEYWFILQKTSWNICEDQFQILKLQTIFVIFLYALQWCK